MKKKINLKTINEKIKYSNLKSRHRIKYPRRRIPIPIPTPKMVKSEDEINLEKRTQTELGMKPINEQTYHPQAPQNQPAPPEIPDRLTVIALYENTTEKNKIKAEIYKARINPYNKATQVIYLEQTEKRTKRIPVAATKRFPSPYIEIVEFRGKEYSLDEFARTMMRNEIEFYELERVITEE